MQDQENRKTVIYVLVAGIALVVAWEPWRPAPSTHVAPPAAGAKLFREFTEALAANSLEITKFDEDTATIRPFKVAQVNGVWSIPSHRNYPADARDHMAAAATSLIDLEILGVVSSSPGDHQLYGVIAPDPQKLKPGMTGVGTQVTLRDDKDKVLADLIVGKEVKDRPSLRYVREAGRDTVYTVALATDQLSTKFEDWIEEDLLKLNGFDVREVSLNDYSIQERQTPDGRLTLGMNPRTKMKLAFDDTKSSWSVLEMSDFDEKMQEVPAELGDDEELDAEKLNALRTALDNLQIIDVERKPKGLSDDLRASEEFVNDNEARGSLLARGFYPIPVEDHIEMFSSEGEATCTTKDGVQYILRFGRLAGGVDTGEKEAEGEEPKSNPALNRYLLVMAQFDESQIPKPELKPMPGEANPDEEAAPDESAPEPESDEPKADAPKSDDAKADETNADAGKSEGSNAAEEPSPGDAETESVSQTKTAQTGAGEEDAAQSNEPSTGDAKASDDDGAKADGASEQSDADGEGAKKADAEGDKQDAKPLTPEEELQVALERENKRRQEEYDGKVKQGRDKVNELNERFADWYFIISDDVYQKIHIGRADVVKKKAGEQPTDVIDSLGDPQLNDLKKGLDAPE